MGDEQEYKNDVCPDGPFVIEVNAYVTDDHGSFAEVGYKLPPGCLPTRDNVAEALKIVRSELSGNDTFNDFRLMTRHEFVSKLMAEHMGTFGFAELAIPGPNTFTLDSKLCDG